MLSINEKAVIARPAPSSNMQRPHGDENDVHEGVRTSWQNDIRPEPPNCCWFLSQGYEWNAWSMVTPNKGGGRQETIFTQLLQLCIILYCSWLSSYDGTPTPPTRTYGRYSYPKLGRWPGDGRERELGPGVVGRILSEYARACLEEVSKHESRRSEVA